MLGRTLAAIAAAMTLLTTSTAIGLASTEKQNPDTVVVQQQQTEKGAIYALSYNEYTELCQVVMAESGGDPYKGQMAVAQCILNTCRIEHKRPIEVVKTHGYAKNRPEPTESIKNAVTAVFADGEEVIDTRVTMFYAPALMKNHWSNDHEQEIYSCTIGGHKFFIERRYA